MKRRALLSVSRKDGIVALARGLAERGFELVSTGGTARELREGGLDVTTVSDVTGFPEILDGRVKTLHPRIHAGLLARRDVPEHLETLERESIVPIDVVVVNLYPFEATVASGAPTAAAIENIDTGGPSMLRAAAKNFADVAIVVDPADYDALLAQLDRDTGVELSFRLALARRAYRHTARYDQAIAAYLDRLEAEEDRLVESTGEALPERLGISLDRVRTLRYGENPHQEAAVYAIPRGATSVATAQPLQGKALSYNNLLDLDAAWGLVRDIGRGACAIIKHTNPAGVGTGATPLEALERAWECDPVSAFGSIIAFNRPLDEAAARRVAGVFVECVIAPAIEPAAREALERKKDLRVIELTAVDRAADVSLVMRSIDGGLLAQRRDEARWDRDEARVASARAPSDEEWRALEFAWSVVKHVKSNAVVYATERQTVGIGAGQMSRVDAARFAREKAVLELSRCVAASDAFFPFRDGLDVVAEAGATAVIQPGGSVRDEEVVAAADEHGMAMVMTGVRHFRH